MRYLICIAFLFVLFLNPAVCCAQRHRYNGLPRTEVELMNSVLTCMKNKDTVSYYNLFPPFDTIWHLVLHNTDHSPETERQLNNLREHPQTLIDFDPYYNHEIMQRFYGLLQKGEDSGIHWNMIVMQRYELHKDGLTRKLIGYDKIAPERFSGYMFVRDMLGRSTYCITISEIQKINGYFFGGQVLNILEASTIEEFRAREHDEQRYYTKLENDAKSDTIKKDKDNVADSTETTNTPHVKIQTDTNANIGSLLIVNTTDDDKPKTRKEVVDRKYYEGKFDDEIPVKLYVRYMKDPATGKVGYWDGLYKFGDQTSYVKLNITKNADGVWIMEDDPPVGTMELELKNKIYTGTWASNGNQTGYDVVLTQADIAPKKLEQLEYILDQGLSGSAAQKSSPDGEHPQKAKQEEGFDPNDQ
jgi:hypothetical protein